MAEPFHLLLPAHFVEEMVAQAKAELPNECCGVLAGTVAPDGTARVGRRYRLTNAAASPVAYETDAKDMFAVVRELRDVNLDILAFYHSHPTSAAVPSKTDHEQCYWTGVVYFIISLKDDTPSLRGWWLTPESATEAAWEVISE